MRLWVQFDMTYLVFPNWPSSTKVTETCFGNQCVAFLQAIWITMGERANCRRNVSPMSLRFENYGNPSSHAILWPGGGVKTPASPSQGGYLHRSARAPGSAAVPLGKRNVQLNQCKLLVIGRQGSTRNKRQTNTLQTKWYNEKRFNRGIEITSSSELSE